MESARLQLFLAHIWPLLHHRTYMQRVHATMSLRRWTHNRAFRWGNYWWWSEASLVWGCCEAITISPGHVHRPQCYWRHKGLLLDMKQHVISSRTILPAHIRKAMSLAVIPHSTLNQVCLITSCVFSWHWAPAKLCRRHVPSRENDLESMLADIPWGQTTPVTS